MYLSVKFNPTDTREYTYIHSGGEIVSPGDIGIVETKDGKKDVVVANVDLPKPPFECKEISFMAPKAGHNNPPDPIDEALAPYGDYIFEAENWLDGEKVENEAQMNAVDDLTKKIKAALKDVNAGEKSASAPLHDAWKAEKARWKPTIDDLERIRNGLVAAVSGFKAKLAAEKQAAEKAAWDAANKARIEAEEKARKADAADIEAQREAAAAAQAAIDAEKTAKSAKADAPKGMRKVHRYEIKDHRAALHWIAANDRDAVTAFIEAYVAKNHKTQNIDGVAQSIEKEAF